jgi:hypothetical protein
MDGARAWISITAATLVAVFGCTAKVEEDGLTGALGSPMDTGDPPSSTSLEDTPGSPGTDASDPGGSSSEGSGAAPEPGGAGEPEPSSTGSEACLPPCAADEICMQGECVPIDATTGEAACNDVPGNYAACLGPGNAIDVAGCGGGDECLTTGEPVIAGVCSLTACADACDCPAAPASGDAPVACDAITGSDDSLCYLDCSGGEACPTGMVCFAELACIWPGEGSEGTPYGDCLHGDASVCGLQGVCLTDDEVSPTVGVCTEGCSDLVDCALPTSGTALRTCDDVSGDGEDECYLDCSFGGSCPAGMSCVGSFICMWE